MQDLFRFFNPQSVAIIGATDKEGKIGNILVKNLLDEGYEGKIFPINPKYEKISGIKCFSKITEIQQEIDLVLVAVPAALVFDVIDGATGRSHNFVVISAGFSETGGAGKILEDKLKKLAKDREINILGPNCLGILNPKLHLNASFASGMPSSGKVAFLSQSGALAVAILDQAKERNLGFSKIISLGNKMQLGENEAVSFLKDDEETEAIGVYLESLEKGREFLRLVSQSGKKKPIVILKAGKSNRAKEAMLSHTGSLSGEAKIAKAAFSETGIIETETIEDFIEMLNFFSSKKLPQKEKVAIVTNAGGPGVLTTDYLEEKKLSLVEISSEIQEELKNTLPEASAVNNPIDLLGDALEDRYQKTLEILEKESTLGIIFCLVTPQEQTPIEKISQVIQEFSQKSQKLIIPIFIGGEKVKKIREELAQTGLLAFSYPEKAIDVLSLYFDWKNKPAEILNVLEKDEDRQEEARGIIERAKGEGRRSLNAFEAEKLISLYGIPVSSVFSASGSGFQFPVVLKIDSEKYLHKSDEGGVILGIKDQEELEEKIKLLEEKFKNVNLIVQPQEEKGEEIILGIKKDQSFGSVVVYGLGGIFTEVFQKVDFIFPGMNLETIKRLLKQSEISFMFEKTRGKKPLNREKFAELIWNLTKLANELPEIKEMDINPLLGNRAEGNFKAVDVKVII